MAVTTKTNIRSDYQWINRWSAQLQNKTVLELGCGSGIDSRVIAKATKYLVACDLQRLNTSSSELSVVQLNHGHNLPFQDNSFDIVIASLSLHYFNWSLTQTVVREIGRVLRYDGLLICRLNSVNDVNYGAVGYPQIEHGFYDVNGQGKRFFDSADICSLFTNTWTLSGLSEKTIDRYGNDKKVWEFSARNC